MELAPKPFPETLRESVSDAKLAYFEGDFERCLDICTKINVRTIAVASEIALLTARAYLRTGRSREAQQTIAASLETHTTLDASLTAHMLLGSAHIREGDIEVGLRLLDNTAKRSAGAHFAIRSEIAFATALGYWAKREIETAELYLAQVDPGADIIHARALELQAWCHMARRAYYRSAETFRATLLRLDNCNASDRAIAGTAVSTLSIFAAELADAEIAAFVAERVQRIEWTSGLIVQRYLTLAHQALYRECIGDTVGAYQFAEQSREFAPTVPFEVHGWALSSAIARRAGEASSAIVFAQRASDLLASVDVRELHGEERFAMLAVAESCAHFAPGRATELFAQYWGLAPVDRMLALSGDPRLTADETYIEGVIAQGSGERERAARCFRKAYEIFSEIGYVRRARIAARSLLELEPNETDLQQDARLG